MEDKFKKAVKELLKEENVSEIRITVITKTGKKLVFNGDKYENKI